jgi:aminoglycoside 3-N-acetyltransferase I
MEHSVQRLAKDDVALMRELNALFADVFQDSESYASKPPSDAYLESFIGNEENIVLVATIDRKVVGGLVAYTLTKFEKERKEGLFVT